MIGPPGPAASTTTMLNSSSSGFPQRCRASTVENRPESLESLEKGAHQVVEIRLPVVRLDLSSDVDGHVVRQRNGFGLSFLLENCALRLEVGRLDVRDQPPLESRA